MSLHSRPSMTTGKHAQGRLLLALAVALTVALAAVGLLVTTVQAGQTNIVGPAGSGKFGSTVTLLANGNIVVTDPDYSAGATLSVGAVYLYNGTTGAMISMLTGSTAGDRISSGGVVTLTTGNYVVLSPDWDNGAARNAGAVTWGNGATGVTGTVSSTNSLVGSQASDSVGSIDSVTALSNGNYVVASANWANGAAPKAGAVTWGDGAGGTTGVVSAANSLVGSQNNDRVGFGTVTALSNSNYVVSSPYWANDTVLEAGAVTWGDGTAGITGVVSSANSLVGTQASDWVGVGNVTALSNGNYVVSSPYWTNGSATYAGAVTWGPGATGITGAVSADNSLVGSHYLDQVSLGKVTALSSGNFVVASPMWANGTAAIAGAVTWADGEAGTTGEVSSANSLVGSKANDAVGSGSVLELSNGNYVVVSSMWANGATSAAGAVTWGDGAAGATGVVSAANSLVGFHANDWVGHGEVTALSNGNYVVSSPYWANSTASGAGAVTWGDGAGGTTGTVSAANSLVGTQASDQVGSGKVTALNNGNYVVSSPKWANGAASSAGAVTWGDGAGGTTGAVSGDNSLVGSHTGDQVGTSSVTALGNGNYVVASSFWYNGAAYQAGAVTWGDGARGITGTVSSANSLVGTQEYDAVGSDSVTVLSNDNYVVSSSHWGNGAAGNAGAVTWGNGARGITGTVSTANSLVGSGVDDRVGFPNARALSNGNYVVNSGYWANDAAVQAGAVTWGNGAIGITGTVSSTNSFVGSQELDRVGFGSVTELSSGSYAIDNLFWSNGATLQVGAVTWGDGGSGGAGPIAAENSVLGDTDGGGPKIRVVPDSAAQRFIVGRPYDNIVTLFTKPSSLGVTLAKTAAPTTEVGYRQLVTYTAAIAVTTEEDQIAVFTDTLPVGTTFARWLDKPAGAAVTADTIAWSGTLNSSAPVTFTFQVTNSVACGATVTNTAQSTVGGEQVNTAAVYATATTLVASGSGNWSEVFPACPPTSNYVIPPGFTVTMDANVELAGNLTVGGTLIPNGKTVTLTGSAPQTLTGSPLTFYNLVIDKSNPTDAVAIAGKLKVSKKLTITSGKLYSASDYGDVEIGANGVLSLTNPITIGGDFTVTGELVTNGNAIDFDGAKEQRLYSENILIFDDLTVMTGTTLLEAYPQDNILVNGVLTNHGVIRKVQAVTTPDVYTFGLAGLNSAGTSMAITVTTQGQLGGLQVDRIDANPVKGLPGQVTGIYWVITPTGGGYVADLTLPYAAALTTPAACRQVSGTTWDCAQDVFDGTTVTRNGVTRNGVTEFSTWAVYGLLPFAVSDAGGTLQDTPVTVGVLGNDIDPLGKGLKVASITIPPVNGVASISADQQTIIYTPTAGYTGRDSFVYVATDANLNGDGAFVTIIVAAKSESSESPQIAALDLTEDTTPSFTSPQAAVDVQLPAGFFTGTVTDKDIVFLSYTPVLTPTQKTNQPPGGLRFGNLEFDLSLFVNNAAQHGVYFAVPVTMTIAYSPTLLGDLSEDKLELYSWNGTAWSTDGIVVVARDLVNHTITLALSHLSDFAFFAAAPTGENPGPEPELNQRLFLPNVLLEGSPVVDTAADLAAPPQMGELTNRIFLPVIQQ